VTKCFDVWLSEAVSRPHPTDISGTVVRVHADSMEIFLEAVGKAGMRVIVVSGHKCRLAAINTSAMDKEESQLKAYQSGHPTE